MPLPREHPAIRNDKMADYEKRYPTISRSQQRLNSVTNTHPLVTNGSHPLVARTLDRGSRTLGTLADNFSQAQVTEAAKCYRGRHEGGDDD